MIERKIAKRQACARAALAAIRDGCRLREMEFHRRGRLRASGQLIQWALRIRRNPQIAPPMCAASPPALRPEVKTVYAAMPTMTHASVLSFIGIGGNRSMTVVSGASRAPAMRTPKTPAEAPIIAEPGVLPRMCAADKRINEHAPATPQER